MGLSKILSISFLVACLMAIGCASHNKVLKRGWDHCLAGLWSSHDSTLSVHNNDTVIIINGFGFYDPYFIRIALSHTTNGDKYSIINIETGNWYTSKDSLFLMHDKERKIYGNMVNNDAMKALLQNDNVKPAPIPPDNHFPYICSENHLTINVLGSEISYSRPKSQLARKLDEMFKGSINNQQ